MHMLQTDVPNKRFDRYRQIKWCFNVFWQS